MREAHCAHCGYDLIGLPAAGSCPECGRGYDKATRRNVGDGGAEVDPQARFRRHFALGAVVLAFVLALIGGGLALVSADPLRPLAFALVAAAAVLVVGLFPLSR